MSTPSAPELQPAVPSENIWQKSKVLVKGLMIGVLVLLLLIPTLFVTNLIEERESRQQQAIAEVSSKCAGRQNLAGPILVLPYQEMAKSGDKEEPVMEKQLAYLLPDELNVVSELTPKERSRGIFKVMLYESRNTLRGRFNSVSLDQLNLDPAAILWEEAFVQINLSDPKGLNEELALQWNGRKLVFSPSGQDESGATKMTAPLQLTGAADLGSVRFSSTLLLNGSQSFYCTPLGRSTSLRVKSTWPHPSFAGAILPQQSSVASTGFEATWKSMAYKRAFPQQWRNAAFTSGMPMQAAEGLYGVKAPQAQSAGYNLGQDAFGLDLYIPVNGYQKTLRSVKYAVLCILLTFCAFFLVETANHKSVHPFQYALIGIALVLFYLLLLSFSEYVGFNWAYAIAGTATVALIGWFMRGLLQSAKLSGLLSLVLVLLYSYVFTILQLQDYSLLLGSVGLFATLAVVMRFSRSFKW